MRLRRRRRGRDEHAGHEAATPAGPPPDVPFPEFTYHPDPRGTGFVVESDVVCLACGRARGYVYTGPAYADEELDDSLCPWCIASGTAAERFDVAFSDPDVDAEVPQDVIEEIVHRTPGFTGWQQEHWLYHCGDGAAFLGLAGRQELLAHPDALDELRRELREWRWSAADVEGYLAALDKDGQPTAYLFRCRHCGRHLAYSDFT